MKAANRKGWDHLIELAQSDKRESRQIALIRAYSWLEHALNASGFRRENKSIAKLLIDAYNQGYGPSTLKYDQIRNAIQTRHIATHKDAVPSAVACVRAVKAFSSMWQSLCYNYVTLINAAKIAQTILNKRDILSVSLFGSLSRGNKANDIDLLVLDNGKYSTKIKFFDTSYPDMAKLTRRAVKLLSLPEFPYSHIVQCRWLDILLLDGTRFGKDKEYTKTVTSHHIDPYFFVNIAKDLMDFDLHTCDFVDTKIPVFIGLRHMTGGLHDMGFL